MPAEKRDLTGMKFGLLTVAGYAGKVGRYQHQWLCKCDCGKEVTLSSGYLSRGTKSCGCLRKKTLIAKQVLGERDKEKQSKYNEKRKQRRLELIRERESSGWVGFKHGNRLTYRAGCRCDSCREASNSWNRKYKEEIKHANDRICGTPAAFASGCRCDECIACDKYSTIRKRYKASRDDIEKLLSDQDSKCAICEREFNSDWYVDHCHETKEVRGLLCVKCNSGLGQFYDDEERMRSAITYLRWHISRPEHADRLRSKPVQETLF